MSVVRHTSTDVGFFDRVVDLFDGEEAEPAESIPFWVSTDRCYACRRRHWWRRGDGMPWVCARCHPPMNGIAREWRGEDDSDE